MKTLMEVVTNMIGLKTCVLVVLPDDMSMQDLQDLLTAVAKVTGQPAPQVILAEVASVPDKGTMTLTVNMS